MKPFRRFGEAMEKTRIVLGYLFFHPKVLKRLLSFSYRGFFVQTGWIRSFIANRPVDVDDSPLPWLTYPMIELLNERLHDGLKVFEYGGGHSTLYFGPRVAEVVTVEHDRQWYEQLQRRVPDNCRLVYQELDYGGDYAATSRRQEAVYDIVLVDGRDRVNSALAAVEAVGDRGVIIFDDFDRDRYQPAASALREQGFRQLNLWGFKPGFFDRSNTAVFYRDGNALGL